MFTSRSGEEYIITQENQYAVYPIYPDRQQGGYSLVTWIDISKIDRLMMNIRKINGHRTNIGIFRIALSGTRYLQ